MHSSVDHDREEVVQFVNEQHHGDEITQTEPFRDTHALHSPCRGLVA